MIRPMVYGRMAQRYWSMQGGRFWAMRSVSFAALLMSFCVFFGFTALPAGAAEYPPVRFAVISDPHVYDSSLGVSGKAFQEYIESDTKLLAESYEILETVVSRLFFEDVDFVLVPGDLTKDGELFSHELAAQALKRLLDAGKKVFVVPGNHDILSGDAVMFTSDTTEPVATVTPEDFARLYGRLGYDGALHRDPNSLSYVVEPVDNLWIVAMDACRYRENPKTGHPITGGKFSEETLAWIEETLLRAQSEGKAVLGMMHHGIVEHYRSQSKYFGEYLVEDWKKVAEMFARNGMKVVFTGHYHAQDAVMMELSPKNNADPVFIFDVETGSLVSYPIPYRLVEITPNQKMRISSHFIDSIPSRPEGFQQYARKYLETGVGNLAAKTLMEYRVSEKSANLLAPQVAAAFLAHYRGDEAPPEQLIDYSGIDLWARIVVLFQKDLLSGLWHDLEPPDNNLEIDLVTGNWSSL